MSAGLSIGPITVDTTPEEMLTVGAEASRKRSIVVGAALFLLFIALNASDGESMLVAVASAAGTVIIFIAVLLLLRRATLAWNRRHMVSAKCRFDGDGITVERTGRIHSIPWDSVVEVTDGPIIYLRLRRRSVFRRILVLPRRCFASGSDADAVVIAARTQAAL